MRQEETTTENRNCYPLKSNAGGQAVIDPSEQTLQTERHSASL